MTGIMDFEGIGSGEERPPTLRYRRAKLLNARGRHEEALRRYASVSELSLHELIYLAPSHLRRAKICEQLGRGEEAIKHCSRSIELWKDCDSPFRSMVDQAETKLASLGAK